MESMHIAIVNVPRPPHINPTLALVRSLSRRGHRVTYGTSMEFAAQVRAVGAELVRVPRFHAFWKRREVSDEYMEEDATDFISLANMTLSYISDFYVRDVPDLIIYDTYSFAGRLLAHKLGVPAVLATPQFEMNMDGLERQGMKENFKNDLLELSASVDRLHEQHGVRSVNALFQREPLNVYYFIKEYQIPGVLDDINTIYAGRCAAERPYPAVAPRFFDSSGRTVLVSTSTTYVQGPDYYRSCAQVLSEMGFQVILATGGEVPASSLQPLPLRCAVAEDVPLASIMPQADLLVCLGGPTTVMEALYHGLPLVLLSQGSMDAQLYANSVTRLGCGLHLEDAQHFREAVLKVSGDPKIHDRVKALQSAVRRSLGAEDLANHIEAFYSDSCERS